MYMLYFYEQNERSALSFAVVSGVLAPGQMSPIPLPKYLPFGWWSSPAQLLPSPMQVQSIIATGYDICYAVSMGIISSGNITCMWG